jgi:hypothetical protein
MAIDLYGNDIWTDDRGQLHRIDGPAVDFLNGSKSWWVNGERYANFKDFQDASGLSDDEMTMLILKYGQMY